MVLKRISGSLYPLGSDWWWDQSKSDWCEPYRSVHRSTAHRDKGTQSWWKTQILCYLGRGNWAQTMPAYADLGKTTHCQKTGFLTWMRVWRGKGGVACKDGAREGWRDVKHCVEVAGTAPQVRSLTDRGNCLSILPKLDFFLIFPSWGIFCVSSFPTGGSSFDIFTKCPTGSNNWILKLGRPSRPMNPLKLCEKYGLQLFFFFFFSGQRAVLERQRGAELKFQVSHFLMRDLYVITTIWSSVMTVMMGLERWN